MKNLSVVFYVLLCLLGVVRTSNAALTTIGTATYDGNEYNLIYEDDSIDGGLVWLDYTKGYDTWQSQMDWASGLGGDLTVTLAPGYTTHIDWATGWRLPLTQDETEGFNQTGSEMGHLYYESLGNVAYDDPGWGLNNVGDFKNLKSGNSAWSGTEYSARPDIAWYFVFTTGSQVRITKTNSRYALAVQPGQVSAVPIPSAIWLLGSGLIGLVGVRRKFRK